MESLVHKDLQERRVNLECVENQEVQVVKESVETQDQLEALEIKAILEKTDHR